MKFWPIRRVLRLIWWILCTLTLLALPLTIWEFSRSGYDIHYQGWFIGGIFVILSFPISVYEVAMHTEHYTRPKLQRHVIRILWMVPIYGVDAWLALRFKDTREYLDPIRECYEAYVIYNFYAYLMAYLEDTVGDLAEHMQKKPPMQHMPVVRWIVPPWQMGAPFLLECKKGVLNYVIIRPLCTGLGLITDIFDLYGQGQINFGKSYIYLAAATNFSQLWALYCLAMMYQKMHEELAPIRPLSKFLVVKAVIFVTFWQSVVLAILVYTGVINSDSWTYYDQRNVATGIQDFLICIEMFFAALAHAYAFPPRDYMNASEPRRGFFANVKHMFDLRDVVEDVTEVVESHATNMVDTAAQTTSTVWRLPKRAVKAVVHAPGNLMQLLTRAGSRRTKYPQQDRDMQEDPESRHALLAADEQEQLEDVGGAGADPLQLRVLTYESAPSLHPTLVAVQAEEDGMKKASSEGTGLDIFSLRLHRVQGSSGGAAPEPASSQEAAAQKLPMRVSSATASADSLSTYTSIWQRPGLQLGLEQPDAPHKSD